jgi:predicted MPP superfamily phosphohydrolase
MIRFLRSRAFWRVVILTFAIVFVVFLWAFWWEPSSLAVVERTIAVQPWHAEHAGLKIAVLSDLHVGAPHRDLARLQELVSLINGYKPDLIVLLGDFVIQGVLGGRFVPPEDIARELSGLKAPLGVVAILGNHDWWLDGERVRRALKAQGIEVLVDQSMRITYKDQPFWLMGLDDLWTRGNHLQSVLAAITDEEPIITLSHSPDIFPDIPQRVTLTLAGHTHGGQVDIPLIGRPIVPSKFGERFAYGLIEERGRKLFVTGGVGTSIIPVRFRVKPEVAILTLIPEDPSIALPN